MTTNNDGNNNDDKAIVPAVPAVFEVLDALHGLVSKSKEVRDKMDRLAAEEVLLSAQIVQSGMELCNKHGIDGYHWFKYNSPDGVRCNTYASSQAMLKDMRTQVVPDAAKYAVGISARRQHSLDFFGVDTQFDPIKVAKAADPEHLRRQTEHLVRTLALAYDLLTRPTCGLIVTKRGCPALYVVFEDMEAAAAAAAKQDVPVGVVAYSDLTIMNLPASHSYNAAIVWEGQESTVSKLWQSLDVNCDRDRDRA